jgi:hypothetical protein
LGLDDLDLDDLDLDDLDLSVLLAKFKPFIDQSKRGLRIA